MIQRSKLFISGACLVWATGLVATAIETPRDVPTGRSLSGFESLGDELLQGIPLPKIPESKPATQPTGHNEDSASSPLERVEHGMRKAQDLLAQQQEGSHAVAVQQQVVTELDALIDELRKAQCKACQGNKSSQSSESRRSKMAGRKPSDNPAKSQAPASSPAQPSSQQSSSRLDSGQSVSAQNESVEEVLRRLWGQLPERVREQMLQTPADEFLPKYRADIEKYFRRLAEEDGLEVVPNSVPPQPPAAATNPRRD